jgi:phosphopantothenoylcysteine decarboxylase / phosphopantothenate---cysteine ligase
MHPSESIRSIKGGALEGKRIVLGITGSIAAVESFELARELIRNGAQVHAVMTDEAVKLVTPTAIAFATGREVVTGLDWRAQHVSLLGDFPDQADLLLVAPCTANTISKMALAIDDSPVTTMATVAIGSKVPVLVAPAMHLSMFAHPIVQKNVQTLKELGVGFIGPYTVGKKARVATVEEIAAAVIRRIGRRDLEGRRVLIIGGSSEEPIDEVRVVSSSSTGETAVQLARAAYDRGAEVELWVGRVSVPVPSFIPKREFRTVEDLLLMVPTIDHDLVIVPASLSDYAPVRVRGKIDSGRKELTLKMNPLPKVLPSIRKKAAMVVGFKAEVGVEEKELIKRARSRMDEYGLDCIVANDVRSVSAGETVAVIIPAQGDEVRFAGSKRQLADMILDRTVKVDR